MTLYRVYIGNNEYQVEISDNHVAVNGEREQGHLIPLNELGSYLLRRGVQARELQLRLQGPSTYEVLSGVRRVIARVMKDRGQLRGLIEPGIIGGLTAPMPGMVVNVKVNPGNFVDEGQVLVVLESMKMQMDLRAPASGRVAAIHVQPGDQVEKGKLLVKIDKETA
ncbi:MAG TPA: acetyl-CoA carboxylase biotin carboxyl carrier protein subunit [Anaerolineaceae bacterium]|nr:acetyl-CoA carboxylase biotin carboxyl carrier protein subunit [Anaerolineaceae bacterium]